MSIAQASPRPTWNLELPMGVIHNGGQFGVPIREPIIIGASGSEIEHELRVGFQPPRTGKFQAFLNDCGNVSFRL
ncbi:MAG TPA: hypothetical protein VN873_13185, partial [Candidatus Angelobacter sp.]|nr:hypothetical protein [Candidatus Angelobacter sp.]